MKTILPYTVAILSMPITGTLIGLLLLPLWALAKRIDAWLPYRVLAFFGATTSSLAMVFVGSVVFRLFGTPFGGGMVAAMLGLLAIYNLGRTAKCRGTDAFSLEVGYTFGGFLGMAVGAAVFVWHLTHAIIFLALGVPLAAFLIMLRTSRAESFPFWNLVSNMPDEAYQWFLNEPGWLVYDPPSGRGDLPSPPAAYDGPFRLSVPTLENRLIKIYGRRDTLEESQQRFLEEYGK